jgi:UDP-N-acetyl-D-mannosaminuronic acid dehydrogenase
MEKTVTEWRYDACVIGLGRVGLPLALSLRDVGKRVCGVDINAGAVEQIARGKMPFREPGFDALLAQAPLDVSTTPEMVAESQVVILAVATPLREHHEPDLRRLERAVDGIASFLRAGQLVCLRSTVPPGTAAALRRRIARITSLVPGEDIEFTYCPERVAQGHVFHELRAIPQIVGADDERADAIATALFEPLVCEVLHTSTTNAELIKLFINAQRYIDFAVANQFAVYADRFGGDVHEVVRLANHDYDRTRIARPGLTGGTCLRKDFAMLTQSAVEISVLEAAWKANESMPMFLARGIDERAGLVDKRVALLGFSFKASADDIRDSPSHRLRRLLLRRGALEVRVNDPYLPGTIPDMGDGPVENRPLDAALDGAEIVVVATNHPEYGPALHALADAAPETWIADLWDCAGTGKVFYRASELELSV